ncbi:hypothetical protein [Sulfobacillus thermosulfidooxidans]|uniref:hypothetical protein n=1 Tax=Sulfobacillus thermosulfidooxidans TaxID=28034 RepID=UPI00096B9CB1|nr:hypothetical protein [Sulfobacillus thermosulfidooxidans]OLZ10299.1 hypothetical protein BFX05_10445 [Sulfobacillus thermosulfidooxidans]OLZ13264.1 hypothetical protein BFX06_12100 [Sulfobacillus thermosulfidooxidans]OLZ21644.1 hypothetical protein BFX07_12525 [Sulfobacillus thermosulfidooxidans]
MKAKWMASMMAANLLGVIAGCGVEQSNVSPPSVLFAKHPANNNKFPGGIPQDVVLSPTRPATEVLPQTVRRLLPAYVADGLSINLPDFSPEYPGRAHLPVKQLIPEIFGVSIHQVPWYYQGTTTPNNPMLLMVDTVNNLAYPSRFDLVSRDVLKGAGTIFQSSNLNTIDQELHGSIADQNPGFQNLYIPTLFTETMGVKGFQQTNPHAIHIVSVGTNFLAPTYSASTHGPVAYPVFHAYSPGENGAPQVQLPHGYELEQGPGTILVGQPLSTIVFRDGQKWAEGYIQWTFIEAYTNKGWYVVFLGLNPVPQNMGKSPVPSSNPQSARLLS